MKKIINKIITKEEFRNTIQTKNHHISVMVSTLEPMEGLEPTTC